MRRTINGLFKVFSCYPRLSAVYRIAGESLRTEFDRIAEKIRRAEQMETRLARVSRKVGIQDRNQPPKDDCGADLRISRMTTNELRGWYISLIRKIAPQYRDGMRSICGAKGLAEAIKFGERVLGVNTMSQSKNRITEARLLLLRARSQGESEWEDALDHLERHMGIPASRAERLWRETQGENRLPFIKQVLADLPAGRAEIMMADFARLYEIESETLMRELSADTNAD